MDNNELNMNQQPQESVQDQPQTPVSEPVQSPDPAATEPVQTENLQPEVQPQPEPVATPAKPKKKFPVWAIILIVLAPIILIVLFVALVFGIIFGVAGSSNKLVCNSPQGNITIMYDQNNLKGYLVSGGMSYDFDKQKEYASQVGVEAYLKEFETWYSTHTTGKCERKTK